MKVYTQTWYRGNNYGSVLQAYSLSEYIKSLGYDCAVLGYHPNKAEQWRLKLINHSIKETIAYKINERAMKKNKVGSDSSVSNFERFDDFRNKCMSITPECTSPQQILQMCGSEAIFICGSDQIWNPYLYDPCYYLEFVQDPKRKIAYAPSFGVSEIPGYKKKRIKNALDSFEFISVREERGVESVKELSGKKAVVVVDPTLLLSNEHWSDISENISCGSPYLFCYFLSENSQYYKIAQTIAAKFGLTIKMLPMVAEDYKKEETIKEPVGPKEWIGLIKNAGFVLTDSFHCTLFAVRFHKNFYTLQRFSENDKRGQNTRIHNLFELTGFSDRLLIPEKPAEKLEAIQTVRFDYSDEQLGSKVKYSKEWLETHLKECAHGLEGNT